MPATTAAEIVARAETGWPLDAVPYSQAGVWNDDDGRTDEDGYRRDCSGFASMALHLPTPGLSTVTLVNVARRVDWAELEPGDLVMLGGPGTGGNAGHVGVVVAVHRDKGSYVMLEQSGGLGPDRNSYRLGQASRAGMVPYRSVHLEHEEEHMHLVRSGAADRSVYFVPGFATPRGLSAAYGISVDALAKAYSAAGVRAVQLPPGMTVAACGLYDIAPGPWPAPAAGGGASAAQVADLLAQRLQA